jgi:hypothetical protein
MCLGRKHDPTYILFGSVQSNLQDSSNQIVSDFTVPGLYPRPKANVVQRRDVECTLPSSSSVIRLLGPRGQRIHAQAFLLRQVERYPHMRPFGEGKRIRTFRKSRARMMTVEMEGLRSSVAPHAIRKCGAIQDCL